MRLLNFEEHIKNIRNQNSKRLFIEAVKSYENDINRGAIILCWISVMEDIFSKCELVIRYQALPFKQEFNKISNDIKESKGNWEENLINLAKNIDVITDFEKGKLKELRELRNKSAHATYNADILINPLAEEARSFLSQSYTYFLQYAVRQGHNYIQKIIDDLKSNADYFDKNELYSAGNKESIRELLKSLSNTFKGILIQKLLSSYLEISPTNKEIKNNFSWFIQIIYKESLEFELQTQTIQKIDDLVNSNIKLDFITLIIKNQKIYQSLSTHNKNRIYNYIKNNFLDLDSNFMCEYYELTKEDATNNFDNILSGKISYLTLPYREFTKLLDLLNNIKMIDKFENQIMDYVAEVFEHREGYAVSAVVESMTKNNCIFLFNKYVDKKEICTKIAKSFFSNNFGAWRIFDKENMSKYDKEVRQELVRQLLKEYLQDNDETYFQGVEKSKILMVLTILNDYFDMDNQFIHEIADILKLIKKQIVDKALKYGELVNGLSGHTIFVNLITKLNQNTLITPEDYQFFLNLKTSPPQQR